MNLSLRNQQKGVEFVFTKILSEMNNDLDRKASRLFRAKYYRDQIIIARELTSSIERTIVDIIKSSEWQLRCIVPQIIPMDRRLKEQEYHYFYYDDDIRKALN